MILKKVNIFGVVFFFVESCALSLLAFLSKSFPVLAEAHSKPKKLKVQPWLLLQGARLKRLDTTAVKSDSRPR